MRESSCAMDRGHAITDDDRLLPATRWTGWAIVAVLVPAFIVLWCFPGRTADLWAWTFKPEMTAIFMGSGYGAGGYFFARAMLSGRWAPAWAGVLAAAVFALLQLVGTVIHYDRFNHGHAPVVAALAFFLWLGLYVVAPPLVAALWLRNDRAAGRRVQPGEALVPPAARWVARAVGASACAAAAVFFVSPSTAIDAWPWTVTPLTARVLSSFVAQVGVGALLLSLDPRWRAWRLLLQTFLVAIVLLLIGAIRAWGDFDSGDPVTWLFLAGLVVPGLAVVGLYRAMET
jgi:hypothetical protein